MGGRLRPESVAGINRMGGRLPPESVVGISRNMHISNVQVYREQNEDLSCLPCSICDSNSETYLTGVKCGAYLTGIYDVKFEDYLTVT